MRRVDEAMFNRNTDLEWLRLRLQLSVCLTIETNSDSQDLARAGERGLSDRDEVEMESVAPR